MNGQHQPKIKNAMADAQDELSSPAPDKDEVGKAIQRALDYAHKAENFGSAIEKIKPHIINVAAWLGTNWDKILGFVGLSSSS
jgi:hypothetical protein